MKEILAARHVIVFLLVLLAAEASAFDDSVPTFAVIIPGVFSCILVAGALLCICHYMKKREEEATILLNQSRTALPQTVANANAFPYQPPPALCETPPPVGVTPNTGEQGYQQSCYPPQRADLAPFQENPCFQPIQLETLSDSPPPKYDDCFHNCTGDGDTFCGGNSTTATVDPSDGNCPAPQ